MAVEQKDIARTLRPYTLHAQQVTAAQTLGTLAARRAHAEAALEAADAQTRAARAQIEARAAEEEAARRQSQAHTADLAAQLDEIDRYAEELRRREDEEARREVARRHETMEQVRALAEEPLPVVPMSRAEQAALLDQLNVEIERDDQARSVREEQERRAAIDRAYRRRQARTLGALYDEKERQERERS